MKNLLNFFFSFDKLFKEKLIVPFFWLAIIVWGLSFAESFLAGINLGPLAFAVKIVGNIITILLALVVFRLLAEVAIAIFRINDNLSPDGGKSELVDIDPVAEARKAAELAAARTREATKTMRDNVGEMSESVQDKAKAATASVREKADDLKSKTGLDKTAIEKPSVTDVVDDATAAKPAVTKPAPKKTTPKKTTPAKTTTKKRGRPAGSKNKTTAAKPAKSTTGGKRGPKPGAKIPRDADGNLLKKDGTPRKKPGPK